jgi:hypothetical protein
MRERGEDGEDVVEVDAEPVSGSGAEPAPWQGPGKGDRVGESRTYQWGGFQVHSVRTRNRPGCLLLLPFVVLFLIAAICIGGVIFWLQFFGQLLFGR